MQGVPRCEMVEAAVPPALCNLELRTAHRTLGTLALWHSGTLALWHLWHFGTPALWHSGTLAPLSLEPPFLLRRKMLCQRARPMRPSRRRDPMAMHEIEYQIFGDDMQYVEVELDPQEATVAEAGGMMYMERLNPLAAVHRLYTEHPSTRPSTTTTHGRVPV